MAGGNDPVVVVQLLCHTPFLVTPRAAAHQASLFFTISQSLLKLTSTESMMPPNHLILCHPLLLPSVFLSIRVFSSELVLHIECPKYCGFNFNISPSNEYSGLISFRIDRLDLLEVQGTLKQWWSRRKKGQWKKLVLEAVHCVQLQCLIWQPPATHGCLNAH